MKTSNKLTLKSVAMFLGVMGLTIFVFSCAKTGGTSTNGNVAFQNCTNCGGITNGQSFFNSTSTDMYYGMNVSLNFIGSGTNTGYNNGQQYNPQYNNGYNNGQYNPQYNNGQYGQNSYYGGSSMITSYSGPVAAQGQLQISQPIGQQYNYGQQQYPQQYNGQYNNGQYGQQYGSCYIPAGTYAIGTVQAGQWNQAIVSGLVLQASGPANLIIQISQAQVAAKSQLGQTWNEVPQTGRLFGNFVIQSANGVNCQISTMIQ